MFGSPRIPISAASPGIALGFADRSPPLRDGPLGVGWRNGATKRWKLRSLLTNLNGWRDTSDVRRPARRDTASTKSHIRAPQETAERSQFGPDARVWLRAVGHDWVAGMIESIMETWRDRGVSTRRNWWHVLAGGTDGRPLHVEGKEFPVFASAQVRQGKAITPNAIKIAAKGICPPVRESGRWKGRADQ